MLFLNPKSLILFVIHPFYLCAFVLLKDAISLARAEEEPEAAARKLTETAYTRGSADNITCIVVRFHHNPNDSETPSTTISPPPVVNDEGVN